MCLFYSKEPTYLGLHTDQNDLALCMHSMHEIAVPISQVTPAQLNEAWYWPKCVLRSGWLCITSRPIFKGDVVRWLFPVRRLLWDVTVYFPIQSCLNTSLLCHSFNWLLINTDTMPTSSPFPLMCCILSGACLYAQIRSSKDRVKV